uniref:uncharacterized protein LOC118522647 isoform X1 n=1 Tax=Halichoerus grypus TaxID=9711 RepID=UPI0016590510|nr:uncharacterized protein LOC118522647 isoform X1 [Halichoerus grypus]
MSYPQVTDVGHVKNEAWLKVKGWLCQWVAKGKSKNELFELWQSRKCVEWLFILETVIWASVASLRRLLHRKTAEHVQTPLRTVEAQAWAIKSDQPGLSIKTVAQSLEPQQSHLSLMQKHINKVRIYSHQSGSLEGERNSDSELTRGSLPFRAEERESSVVGIPENRYLSFVGAWRSVHFRVRGNLWLAKSAFLSPPAVSLTFLSWNRMLSAKMCSFPPPTGQKTGCKRHVTTLQFSETMG